MRDWNIYLKEEEEIAAHLSASGKSDKDRYHILEECFKDEDAHKRWLSAARNNKPVDDSNVKKAASHNDGHQRHNMASDIKKRLIIRAQAEAHDAIKHGNIDPLVAVNDALSNAIDRAVDDARAAARAEVR